MTKLTARRAMFRTLLFLLLLAAVSGTGASGEAAGAAPFTAEYPMPGSPYQVAVEAPNLVWATLPAQNAIVRLEVTSPGLYEVAQFELPVVGSEPYGIAFAAGRVWVTERSGNRIGCFDTVTSTWTEYSILTPDSEPTGITVIVGEPIEVWFAERAGNKLGLLTITETGTSQFAEFPLTFPGADLESVAATSSENVWFTAPGGSLIGHFALSFWLPPLPGNPDPGNAFGFVPTGVGSRPRDIKIDSNNRPWITEPSTNRIGRFTPATTTSFEWYPVFTAASGLEGLDLALGYVWFTEQDSGRVGQLQKVGYEGRIRERSLPGADSAPTDIAIGSDGCAWVAASGTHALVSWCTPYFRQVYSPLIGRE